MRVFAVTITQMQQRVCVHAEDSRRQSREQGRQASVVAILLKKIELASIF